MINKKGTAWYPLSCLLSLVLLSFYTFGGAWLQFWHWPVQLIRELCLLTGCGFACIWALLWFQSHRRSLIWRLTQSDDAWPLLASVLKQFRQALILLKAQCGRAHWWQLRRRPWLFIVGQAGVGKTTLLSKAGLTSEAVPQLSDEETGIHWSVCQGVVILDVDAKWLTRTANDALSSMWRCCLKRWAIFRARQAHTNIAVIVACDHIQRQDQVAWRQLLQDANHQCESILSFFPKARVTVLLNKADTLLGFNAFFSAVSPAEREQLCGLSLMQGLQGGIAAYSAGVETLLQRIDFLALSRLHTEQNILQRDLLRAFPQRLSHFMAEFGCFIEGLSGQCQSAFMGVYLTSADQDDELSEAAADHWSALGFTQTHQARPFFLRDLFTALVSRAPHHTGSANRWHWTIAHCVLGIACIAGGLGYFHHEYQQQQNVIQRVKALMQRQPNAVLDQPDWLQQLQTMRQAVALLRERDEASGLISFTAGKQLLQSVGQRYQDALQQVWVPRISRLYQRTLHADASAMTLPVTSYADLKDALSWQQFSSLTVKEQTALLSRLWQRYPVSQSEQQAMLAQLPITPAMHLQMQLPLTSLSALRIALKDQPKENLIWMQLHAAFGRETPKPRSLGPLFTIPHWQAMYGPETGAHIVRNVIPALVARLAQGDAALDLQPQPLTAAQKTMITQSVTQRYQQTFAAAYPLALETLQKTHADHAAAAVEQLHALVSPSAGVWQWLMHAQAVIADTSLQPDVATFWQAVQHYHELSTAGAGTQFVTLTSRLGDALASPKQSWQLAQREMQLPKQKRLMTGLDQLASVLPTVMQSPLKETAQSIWQQLLKQSAHHVDTLWQAEIVPFFNEYLAGRYPLAVNGIHEVTPRQFTQFFGPGGLLQRFFENHLQAFVDTSSDQWQLKKVHGFALPLRAGVTHEFVQGSAIQQALYADNIMRPSLQFDIQSTHTDMTAELSLTVGDAQQILSQNGVQTWQHFSWPGTQASSDATLVLHTEGDGILSVQKSGAWSWLHLLDSGHLHAERNSAYADLDFELQAHHIHLRLQDQQALHLRYALQHWVLIPDLAA